MLQQSMMSRTWQQQIQNGFPITQTTPGIFQKVSQLLFRHVISCVEANGGHCTFSLISWGPKLKNQATVSQCSNFFSCTVMWIHFL